MENTDCKNCGADRGLHHFETMQCPVNGREAPIGRKQEWMTTTFEVDEFKKDATIAALRSRIAELEAGLKLLADTTSANTDAVFAPTDDFLDAHTNARNLLRVQS